MPLPPSRKTTGETGSTWPRYRGLTTAVKVALRPPRTGIGAEATSVVTVGSGVTVSAAPPEEPAMFESALGVNVANRADGLVEAGSVVRQTTVGFKDVTDADWQPRIAIPACVNVTVPDGEPPFTLSLIHI